MSEHPYESAASLKQAVKDLARSQGLPLATVQRDFIFHRFLHRVFVLAPTQFVLKGGHSMLARIPDARTTRDIDFTLADSRDLNTGIALLREAGLLDEGDFLRFEQSGEKPISGQDLSRFYMGKRITFDVYEEGNKTETISVDLVSGCNITDVPQKMAPLNRVVLPGLSGADYLLYPTVDRIADKLCATLEKYEGGRDSSRMRDLVDLVITVLNEEFSAAKLRIAIDSELSRRKLQKPSSFAIPASWKSYPKKLRSFVPEEYRDINASVKLVASMLDPILAGKVTTGTWKPSALAWKAD